jgi:hypothetical protein
MRSGPQDPVGDNLCTFTDLDRQAVGRDRYLLHRGRVVVTTARDDNVQSRFWIWTSARRQQRIASLVVQVQVTSQGRQEATVIVPANLPW